VVIDSQVSESYYYFYEFLFECMLKGEAFLQIYSNIQLFFLSANPHYFLTTESKRQLPYSIHLAQMT
jgi:hypothetical protein